MKEPAIPASEAHRLEVLRSLRVLDTPAEPGFDRLTRLAQHVLGVPIALVSLVDVDRQWFKSRQGLDAAQTPRSVSFCGHAIHTPELFVIPDALADERFADNPLVLEAPNVRFYAGAPLTVDGERVGTLCAIDRVPRQPSPAQLQALRDLADCVEQQLRQADLHRAALRLKDQEARLRAVMDSVADAILTVDPQGIIRSTNPAASQLFGYPPGALLGQQVARLVPGREAEVASWLRGEGEQARRTGELVARRADGAAFAAEVTATQMEVGGERLYTAIVRDVSERNRTQRELNQFKSTLDQTRDCLIMFWPDSLRIFYANLGATQQVGYPTEALVGMTPVDLKPEFTEASYRQLLQPLLEGKQRAITFETVHRHQDGRRIEVEAFVQYVTPQGEAPRFVNIVRDISERRRAERQLRELSTHLQAMVDSSNFSVISTGPDGVIRSFNRGAEAMLGYRAEELVGQATPASLHDPEELAARAAQLTEALGAPVAPGLEAVVALARKGEVDEREWSYLRKDGSRLPVLLSVTAMRDGLGELFGFLVVAIDLTERKRVERLKNEFISTVSHELRTPLTSIRGALGLVLGKASAELSPRVLTLLQTAQRNSERLTLLINDILDLEKLEAGALDFVFKPLDLVAATRAALASLESYARQYEVSLSLVEAPPQAFVSADEVRLGQVFANLVSNAVKFSPSGATVEVKVERSGGSFRVQVHDAGPGIPESFRGQVFERFAQADGSDSRRQGGSGLGLSIARSIVQRHQGSIGFSSEPGQGTDFFFTLPAVEAPAAARGQAAGPLLLVCRPGGDVARMFPGLLAARGFSCDLAHAASDARLMLRARPYQGLLLDLGLPDGEAMELVRGLRSQPGLERLPLVVVSGRADEARAHWQGDALGLLDWVRKPVAEDRLVAALKAAVAGPVARPRVLHVEDDDDVVQVARAVLEEVAQVEVAATLAGARQALAQHSYDVVLLDLSLPDGSGLELLEQLGGRTRVVVFSGQEPGPEVSQRVAATLTKSRSSNAQLLETITRLLGKEQPQ